MVLPIPPYRCLEQRHSLYSIWRFKHKASSHSQSDMCLPAAALPVMAIASGVIQGAGQLYSGLAANAQGKYESQVAKINAAQEVEAAHESVIQGQRERRDFWRKIGQVKGQNIAAMAANGIDVGFGTAARVQEDTQMLAEADAENLYSNIAQRTKGHYINASNYVSEAKAARSRGKSALIGAGISAFGSVLGGFQQAGALKAKMGTSHAGNG